MKAQKRKRKRGAAFLLQFTLFKRRRALYLPTRYSDAQASRIAAAIQECAAAIEAERNVDKATWAFLNSMSNDLKERFVRAGLIERDKTPAEILRAYFDANHDWSNNTKQNKAWSVRTIGAVLDLTRDDITDEEWQAAFDTVATKASRSLCVTTFRAAFNWAIDQGMLDESPVKRVKMGGYVNKEREHFVTREEFEKLVATADASTRALLACYRYGGLRSAEASLLEWADVGDESVRVRSPKTEKKGKVERDVPLFPEWREKLEELEPGRGLIFPRWNASGLWQIMARLFRESGVKPWARSIQNLRASRASEIQSEFGEVCESAWLGHTPTVARQHYLQPTADDLRKAVAKKVANG